MGAYACVISFDSVGYETHYDLEYKWGKNLSGTLVILQEGIRGLYAGTVPALAANVAENAILFCAYGYMRKRPILCLAIDQSRTVRPAWLPRCMGTASRVCSVGYERRRVVVAEKLVAGAAGKKVERLGAVENALSGSAAAVFSSFALCPTELVKCRLQVAPLCLRPGLGSTLSLL